MHGFLMAFATHDGQTGRIAERIAARLEAASVPVRACRFGHDSVPAPEGFDGFIAGSCVRYGRCDKRMIDYLRIHASALSRLPTGLFSVDLISRDPGKDEPRGNVYARKLLARVPFRPGAFAIFPGRLDYPRYRWYDRLMIRAIMRATGGPTDPASVIEYTDWDAVDRFASRMLKLSAGRAHEAPRPPRAMEPQ
jgi:menaquinone-dependent protoporphyrinogen oxidase